MRTIVCTTGTSVVGGTRVDWNQPETAAKQIQDRLRELREEVENDREFLRRASAETNSLERLSLESQDRVVLLHSQTDNGLICCTAVQRLLESAFESQVQALEVKGLQVHDANAFRRVGIQCLFDRLDQVCSAFLDNAEHEIILNATGGFKSVVPYLVLYGLLHRLKVIYIFERSDALITLPPAPINFDYERIGQASDALAQLDDNGAIPREQFFEAIRGLEWHDRPWYESLLEEEEETGLVTLSAFGLLMVNATTRERLDVKLSPGAKKTYEEADGVAKSQFTFMLSRVADPLWRNNHKHAFDQTDLDVFKPGNTGQRLAGVIQGQTVYVCELLRNHADYVRVLPNKKKADYTQSEFVPWARPADQEETPATEEEQFRQLSEKCEQLEACWKDSEQQGQQLREELSILQNDVQACRENLDAKGRELADAQRQLTAARLPWWRRLFIRSKS